MSDPINFDDPDLIVALQVIDKIHISGLGSFQIDEVQIAARFVKDMFLEKLAQYDDPVAVFDNIARNIVAQFPEKEWTGKIEHDRFPGGPEAFRYNRERELIRLRRSGQLPPLSPGRPGVHGQDQYGDSGMVYQSGITWPVEQSDGPGESGATGAGDALPGRAQSEMGRPEGISGAAPAANAGGDAEEGA